MSPGRGRRGNTIRIMEPVQTIPVHCAYCGEPIEVVVDCSIAEQTYVEDCQVCCRPLVLRAEVDADGVARVEVRYENE